MTEYIAAGLFSLIALYAAWIAVVDGPFGWTIWAALLLIAAAGLVRHRRWARYLALGLSGLNIIAWIGLCLDRSGVNWPFAEVPSTAVTLLPGLLWTAVWAVVAVNLYRRLRQSS